MRKLTSSERKIMYAVWNGNIANPTRSMIEQGVGKDWKGDRNTLYAMIEKLRIAGFLAGGLEYEGSRSVQSYKIVISKTEYEQWLAKQVNDRD